MKSRPRCTAIRKRDGQRCELRCHDGLSPALCHQHRNEANGTPVGGAHRFQKAPKTPQELIEKISLDDKHSQQLQAIKLRLDLEREAKGTDDPGARMAAKVFVGMDHDTREAVRRGYAQVRLARERFLAHHPELVVYASDGITRVDGYTDPVKIARVEGPFGIQLHEDGFSIVNVVPLSEVAPPEMPEVVAVPTADQGYATEDECEAANPTCIAIHEIDGRFFAELPDDED